MSQILNKIRNIDPNNNEAAKETISIFVQNLAAHSQSNCYTWLDVLHDTINKYPRYFVSHRSTVEQHLAQFLNSSNLYNSIEAAKCCHSLQQVRPSQEKTATPKTCWREQMSMLCDAAHALIGAIFTNAVDIFKQGHDAQRKQSEASLSNTPFSTALLEINEVNGIKSTKDVNFDIQDKHNLLCTRIKNIFIFMQAMLVESYPVAKPVRPQTILDVIVRTLTVSSGALGSLMSPDDVASIKIQALRTLDALVHCLGPNLVPFSPLVFRLSMQTLRWSSENPTEHSREVRTQAYKSLTFWLTTLRCHKPEAGHRDAKGKCLEDELTQNIVADITPPKHVVQLTMNAQPTKHLSKKAKRKLANNMLQSSAIASHIPGEKQKADGPGSMNEELTIAALECLGTFLTVCGIFIKPTNHKLFQERIIRECFTLSQHTSSVSLHYLRALECSRTAAAAAVPPPTQYCMDLYSKLAVSDDVEVSKLCREGLLNIRLQLHCSPATISYVLTPPREEGGTGDQQKHKFISDRNRAALENLLGADKVPNNSKPDEVITIPDEPSVKKARIETNNVENICISDDEDNDVEIQEADTSRPEVEVAISDIEEPIIIDETIIEENATPVPVFNNDETQNKNVHEAITQVQANLSNDTTDGRDTPHSIEVDYDNTNTIKSNVTLDTLEGDNLPSTNETDDFQITCGQVIKNSHETAIEKDTDNSENKENEPKVNGTITVVDGKLVNDDIDEKAIEIASIKASNNDGATVEDMLADFVDEVNEETVIEV